MLLISRRLLFRAALVLLIAPFLVLFVVPAARAAPGGYAWPVSGEVIRGFERPTGPYGEGGHQGIDIAAEPGRPVRAAAGGVVAWVGELPRGRFVSVSHPAGVRTTYLDLEAINVVAGARVSRGQVIGTIAGRRDSSSGRSHLHFDTSLNGHPVDPRLMLDGLEADSFIRLCPVERGGGAAPGTPAAGGAWESTGASPGRRGAITLLPERETSGGPLGLIRRGISAAWGGACALGRSIVNLAEWSLSNRYVQAVVIGFTAALVVVIAVVIAFFLLPISAVVATIAAIVGSLACIVTAVVYAACSGPGFSAGRCFWMSLSAGAVAASAVISWGALSGPLAAGWAEVGLAGTLKAAAWNGIFSAIFDTGATYLMTGRVSWKGALIAFVAGAVTGGVGKVLKEGIFSRHLVGILSLSSSETTALTFTEAAVIVLKETALKLEGVLVMVKQLSLTFGGKVAYVVSWGMLTAGLNALACAVTHRPVTWQGVLASFLAGSAMGGIALSFKGGGLSGLLSRLRFFRHGLGGTLRGFAAKLLGKGISKGLKSGLEAGFRKLSGQKEVSR